MNIMKSIVLTLIAMVVLFGCAVQDNPVAPVQDSPPAALQKMPSPAPILQTLPPPLLGYQRLIKTTVRIKASTGGTIYLSNAYLAILGLCSRDASLYIPPGALEQDTDITVAFDTQVAGLRFAPEGLVFKTPASLNFSLKGLDLRNLLQGTSYDFYYDSETGIYERQISGSILTNLLKGLLSCQSTRINHFSRYAFGR